MPEAARFPQQNCRPKSSSLKCILLLTLRDDPDRAVRQRPLKRQRVGSLRLKPLVNFRRRRQNDRHGLRMNWSDDRVRIGRQEAEDGRALRPRRILILIVARFSS